MPNLDRFEEKLAGLLDPGLTAKELAARIVTAALESEFGKTFTLTPGFARMVSTLADSIVTNPELRRQTLAIASVFINKQRVNSQTSIRTRNQKNALARRAG
jgi:hypothetical protein